MRKTLKAANGKVLTNGEIYCSEIDLAVGVSPDTFYEITDAEYAEILAKEVEAMEELGI